MTTETTRVLRQQFAAPPHHAADPDDLLTVKEVAKALRVDETTVRRWIKRRLMEAVTLPHLGNRESYRIKRHVLERLLHPADDPSPQPRPQMI